MLPFTKHLRQSNTKNGRYQLEFEPTNTRVRFNTNTDLRSVDEATVTAADLHCGGIDGPPSCWERIAMYKMRNTTNDLEWHAKQHTNYETQVRVTHTHTHTQIETTHIRESATNNTLSATANTRCQFYSPYAITYTHARINNADDMSNVIEQVWNGKQHIPDTRGQCYSTQAICVVMSIAVHLQWVY